MLKKNRELSNYEENSSKSEISKSNYEYIHFDFDEEEKPELKKESNCQENASEIISNEVEINVKGELDLFTESSFNCIFTGVNISTSFAGKLK